MNRIKSTVCLVGTLTLAGVTTTAVAQSTNTPQRTVEQRLRIVEQQLSSQALIAMMQDVRALLAHYGAKATFMIMGCAVRGQEQDLVDA